MTLLSILIGISICMLVFGVLWYKIQVDERFSEQKNVIQNYTFPASITNKIHATYPHLSDEDVQQVLVGLKQYFEICAKSNFKIISMPSQVVDVAWHEFILDTRAYQKFCSEALGEFLHHIPAEAMSSPTSAQSGIKRAWKYACKLEGLRHDYPNKLPLIFSLDKELKIPDGFKYHVRCTPDKQKEEVYYCAAHITPGGCSGGGYNGCGGSGGCS